MVTELIRPVKYNPGRSQKLIKLEISSCRCSQLECYEKSDETPTISVVMLTHCGPLPQAYRVHTSDETEGYSALYTPLLPLKVYKAGGTGFLPLSIF